MGYNLEFYLVYVDSYTEISIFESLNKKNKTIVLDWLTAY